MASKDDPNLPVEVYGPGRCLTCGLLGKAPAGTSPQAFGAYEATWTEREDGLLFKHETSSGTAITKPICIRFVTSFVDDLEGVYDSDTPEVAVQALLQRDRECEQYFEYTPLFNPKEHFEEHRMVKLEGLSNKLASRSLLVAVGQILVALMTGSIALLALWFAIGDDSPTIIVTQPTVVVELVQPTAAQLTPMQTFEPTPEATLPQP